MAHLQHDGWVITSFADTASREPRIDIVATRNADTLAIEVKGFPGRNYADPRRQGEKKRAQPSTQAKGWYGRAVLVAMLTRSRMPQARSVIALPDFPRYRSLPVPWIPTLVSHTQGRVVAAELSWAVVRISPYGGS